MDHPVRTATGVAILTFFAVLTLAGGNDVLAFQFGFEVEFLTRLFRWLAFLLPVAAWIVTYRLCRARLREGDRPSPPIAGRAVVRRPDGGFEEIGE